MDVLVEDCEENLKYGDFVRILFTYPWNKSINDEVFKIERVEDWYGIYNAIKNIKPCGKDTEDVGCFDCDESYDSNGIIVCGQGSHSFYDRSIRHKHDRENISAHHRRRSY